MTCEKRNRSNKFKKRFETLREKEKYKYMEMLEEGPIKVAEMKWKIKKENLRRTKKRLEKKLRGAYDQFPDLFRMGI